MLGCCELDNPKNARCWNRGWPHLVWQREEIIVESENIHAGNEVLDPALSTMLSQLHVSHHILYRPVWILDESVHRAGESKGEATHKFAPSATISCTSWEDAMAKHLMGTFLCFWGTGGKSWVMMIWGVLNSYGLSWAVAHGILLVFEKAD